MIPLLNSLPGPTLMSVLADIMTRFAWSKIAREAYAQLIPYDFQKVLRVKYNIFKKTHLYLLIKLLVGKDWINHGKS